MHAPISRRELLIGAAGVALGSRAFLPQSARGVLWTSDISPRSLAALRAAMQGDVVARGQSGYARAKLLYNTRFDGSSPLAIAYCESAADVAAALSWARRTGVPMTARSGGHSYAGYSTTRGLVIDVSRLAGVQLGSGATATIGAGARLVDVYAALAARGRSIPGGSCPSVGIAGLTLGGGVGFSSRLHGTTADNLVGLTLVDASGRIRTCSKTENPDLFWACRGGGGGNFGIVTSFRFQTYPVSTVSTFAVEWAWEDARRAVDAWQRFAPFAPDALFSACTLTSGADGPQMRAEGQYYGSAEALERLLDPLRVSGGQVSTAERGYLDAMLWWAGCDAVAACHLPPRGNLARDTFRASSDYAARPLAPAGITTLVEAIERRQAQGGVGAVILDSYGGAINRVPRSATAFAHRNMLFSIQYGSYWTGAGGGQAMQWPEALRQAMQPHVSGAAYVNYIDPSIPDWSEAFYGGNYARLQVVKKKYDPENVFRFAQSIRLPSR